MKEDRVRELWSRLLSSRDLTRVEESELVEALEADEALRGEFLRDARMDGVLRQFARTDPERKPEMFRIRLLQSLAAQRDGGEFARRVQLRTSAGQGPSTRRALRRGARNETRIYWRVGLAAGALISITIVLIALRSGGPESRSGGGVSARSEKQVETPHPLSSPKEPVVLPGRPEQTATEGTPAPSPEGASRPKPQPDLNRRIEEQMRRAVEEPRRLPDRPEKTPVKDVPVPLLPEPPKSTVPDPKPPHRTTVMAIAKVVETGAEILWGQGLRVKQNTRIAFPDGTRLELEGGTDVREFSETPGKRVVITGGSVLADVPKQAHPMVFATSQGETTILGTRLRLSVDSKATRVEVSQGHVSVKRLKDKSGVEIASGHFAVLAEGAAPKPQKTVRRAIFRFDFEDGTLPAGWSNGQVERGPARPGNRFCVAAAEKADKGAREAILGGKGSPLFTVESGIELTFDCYWAAGASQVWVYLWNDTQERAFRTTLPRAEPRQWTQARVRLEEFRGEGDASSDLKPGDVIRSMGFGGEFEGESALYIDNVEISQSR